MARKNYGVSPERFVQTWQECNTIQEVADKLNMPKNLVFSRSANYRKVRSDGTPGVPLKVMPRQRHSKVDIGKLTKLVEQANVSE